MITKLETREITPISLVNFSKLLIENDFLNARISSKKSSRELFEADYQTAKFFLKVGRRDQRDGENLKVEKNILDFLYPDLQSFLLVNNEYVCLAVPELEECNQIDFHGVRQMLKNIDFSDFQFSHEMDVSNTLESLISAGIYANEYLLNSGEISPELFKLISSQIELIDRYLQKSKRTINHGDVCNSNIYQINGDSVLLDWEDSILGIPGYDEVYWLTFLENHKYIDIENLKQIPLPLDVTHSLFFLIVTIKEYLGIMRCAKPRIMTPADRLKKLLLLPEFG